MSRWSADELRDRKIESDRQHDAARYQFWLEHALDHWFMEAMYARMHPLASQVGPTQRMWEEALDAVMAERLSLPQPFIRPFGMGDMVAVKTSGLVFPANTKGYVLTARIKGVNQYRYMTTFGGLLDHEHLRLVHRCSPATIEAMLGIK